MPAPSGTFLNGGMVTVRHRTVSGQDDYGNDTYSYTTAEVGPCSIQQASSREDVSFNDQVITGITVYMPPGTDIEYIDAMIIDGIEYEINGEPETFKSPFSGNVGPITVRGSLVKGASS